MPLVTILARDNDKPGNRELMAFLEPNWDTLLRNGLTFDLKIVEDAEIPDLIKKGLDKLPVALFGDKQYASSVDIKMLLTRYLQQGRPARPRDATLDVREYYKDEMSFEAAEREREREREMEEDGKRDIMAKYQEEVERRNQEEARRGPPKPKGRKTQSNPPPRRRDNVALEEEDPEERDTPRRTPGVSRREGRIQGGDPGNADDRRLMDMFETSDDM